MTVEIARMFTAADLLDIPEDNLRYEVLEGALVVSPYPAIRHQVWVLNVVNALQPGAPDGYLVLPGANVDAGTNAPIPDVLVVRVPPNPADVFALPDDILMVAEVLSPGQEGRDRLLKRSIYARIGVPVYWIVNPVAESVTVLRLAGSGEDAAYDEAYEGTDLGQAATVTWTLTG